MQTRRYAAAKTLTEGHQGNEGGKAKGFLHYLGWLLFRLIFPSSMFAMGSKTIKMQFMIARS
jgi:hypothetical protein